MVNAVEKLIKFVLFCNSADNMKCTNVKKNNNPEAEFCLY